MSMLKGEERDSYILNLITKVTNKQRRFRNIIKLHCFQAFICVPITIIGIATDLLSDRYDNYILTSIIGFCLLFSLTDALIFFLWKIFNPKYNFFSRCTQINFLMSYLFPYLVWGIFISLSYTGMFEYNNRAKFIFLCLIAIQSAIQTFLFVRKATLKNNIVIKYLGFNEDYGYTNQYLSDIYTLLTLMKEKKDEKIFENVKAIIDVS